MAATTTIRVSRATRERLKALSARERRPAGEIVAALVAAADEERMLADAAAAFERIAGDPDTLARYRAETDELEAGFDAPAPAW
jgi:predicted DNA-binding protein